MNKNNIANKMPNESLKYNCRTTIRSAAHKMLVEMITRPRLITAVRKLSNYHQTSGLEAKHALDNLFASKNIFYPYHSLMARY
jgi:hypothetical protein